MKDKDKKYIIDRIKKALRKESLDSYSFLVLKEALEYIKETP